MIYTLRADQCPVPTGPTAAAAFADCSNSVTSSPCFPSIGQYAEVNGIDFNQWIAALYTAGAFGGLGYGIISGLGLSAPGGLTIQVAAGVAFIGGQVEKAGTTDETLPDDTDRCWIWLKQDGTLAIVAVDTDAPQNEAVLLGSCVTAGGEIVGDLDYSLVPYLGSGLMQCNSADRGAPANAPTSNVVFVTGTLSGLYLFNGFEHVALGTPSYSEAITGTFTMTDADAPDVILSASGGDQFVDLPDTGARGFVRRLTNGGAFGDDSLIVRVGGDAICTLLPKSSQSFVALGGGDDADPVYQLAVRAGSYLVETLVADRTLSALTAQELHLESAGLFNVILPDPTKLPPGFMFRIYNDNVAIHLHVRNASNTVTVCDLPGGEYIDIPLLIAAGVTYWPVGPLTASASPS